MIIESPQNQHVKRLRSLATRKGRRSHRQFLVEGVRALEEAIGGRLPLVTVALCPELIGGDRAEELAAQLAGGEVQVLRMAEEAFLSLSQVQSPEGIAAAVSIPQARLEDLPTDAELLVAAVDLRDPGNMGSLVRTADAAGAQALVAAGTCVDLFDPKVVRATAGSIFHVPVINNAPPLDLIAWAREAGVRTVAGCLEDARPYTAIRYPERTMVMVGNEANGLREDVAKRADLRAYIPMPGRAESLNVTVAAGIVIWEILRQRHG
ncbi:MAG: TrmH family RNA methyltransferase [Armatimonadota bacterium]